jgi:uncharacterized repeat protein (TIGR04138 family)
MHHPKLEALLRRDDRYAYEAYEFVFAALTHTLGMLGRKAPADPGGGPEPVAEEFHVSGQQLLAGVRDLALREFGMLARTVFRFWGVNQTDDFGEIVFNLIEAGMMNKTARDDRADFHAVYDLDEALTADYRIELPRDLEDR